MPLLSAPLAQTLEGIFRKKPGSVPDAAMDWANAYLNYASSAMSSAGSLPVTAAAGLPVLMGAFLGALQSQTPAAAAASMAQGVTAFWAALVWAGPTAAGTTLFPGNAALAGALSALFADTQGKSDGEKARQFADAFDAGAKMVMVNDIPIIQPAPPIIGPIS